LPSFARRVAFSELLRQFFSLWLRLQPEMAIPAWAVRSAVLAIARSDKVLTDAANLLLERSFDLSDLFLDFAGVFFGIAFGL
jgi:hypothetical protein